MHLHTINIIYWNIHEVWGECYLFCLQSCAEKTDKQFCILSFLENIMNLHSQNIVVDVYSMFIF